MSKAKQRVNPPARWIGFLLAILLLAGCTVPVRVEWATEVEMNTAGFDLYRGEAADGPFDVKINDAPIPASTDPMAGGEYSYVDRTAQAGKTYYYELHELELTGAVNTYGPIAVHASWLDTRWAVVMAAGVVAVIALWALIRRRDNRPGRQGPKQSPDS